LPKEKLRPQAQISRFMQKGAKEPFFLAMAVAV
jgi:hypothetical protein